MSKLNPNAQKWVDALRSGKYEQCQGRLGDEDSGYCCLGVLAVVSGLPFDRMNGGLPAPIREWAGLESRWGQYGEDLTLTGANDQLNMTLPEIADLIEEHAEELGVSA